MAKHLRLGKVSDDALAALKATPGVVAIVLHVMGKKGEHPHWHVWMETGGISHEAVRKRLRKLEPFKTYSGNEDWSLRDHDSYTKWSEYVMRNTSAQVLYEVPDESHPPLPPVAATLREPALAVTGGGSAVAHTVQVVRPKRSKAMKVLFCEYLKDERGWFYGCVSSSSLEEKKKEVIDELTVFWENAFTIPQGEVIINYAIWVFADMGVRDWIKANNYKELHVRLRV